MMYFAEAARSLYATKQRTLLALIGIVIGIGSVIALVSIGKIVRVEAIKEFRTLGTDMIIVFLRTPFPEQQRRISLFTDIAQATRCIKIVAPYIRMSTDIETDTGDMVKLVGIEEGYQQFSDFQLSAGRFLSVFDKQRPYAVLGSNVPRLMELSTVPAALIGKDIMLQDTHYSTIGILEPLEANAFLLVDPNNAVFVPIEYVMANNYERVINVAVLISKPQFDPSVCAEQVRRYFERRFTEEDMSLYIVTAEELISQMRKQADLLAVLLTAVGSISLIVGGVGIMNIMLVSVSERKQEIGIRRALGAKRRDIRYQFLTESVVLSLVGGALGVVLSVVTTYYVAQYNAWDFFITWDAIVLGAGISAAIGVFFGFFPAHQAAKLDPIQALRGE